MPNLEQISITDENLHSHLEEWKQKALLNDRHLDERLELEGLSRPIFAKLLELSKSGEG